MSEDRPRDWTVLVIGGAAGVGKTTAARDLAARCGVSVLPTDAIWFAPKAATDPMSYPELHYFDPPDAEWQTHKAEYWCERHIKSAKAISQAMDPVIEYYLSERWPVIVEGTWITTVTGFARQDGDMTSPTSLTTHDLSGVRCACTFVA